MTTDLGATTKQAREIYTKSRNIVSKIVPGSTLEDNIIKRCITSTGDVAFKELIVFKNNPVQAGLNAIQRSRPIYTDIRMVQVGIVKKGHHCQVHCALDHGETLARQHQITRTSAGFLTLGEQLNDAILVIGNAPSAATTIGRMIEQHHIQPALVVATPVGFVNAAESKEYIKTLPLPSITCTGTRGGTPVAVAIINEMLNWIQREN